FIFPSLSLVILSVAGCEDVVATSVVYRATHNSYSGDVDGAKGPILTQLDGGVRFIELDVHDNGYDSLHDYQIGHGAPGDLVDHSGGNPASNGLRDWLAPIADWSARNASHAGLVVMLDLKDDLTDNTSYAAGNLGALDVELVSAFGAQLFP